MANFAGLRGTGSFGTGERPQDFREMILWTNPNGTAPLFALSAKMKKESCDDPQIHWWEETNTVGVATVNGALTSGATTCVVDAASGDTGGALQFLPGDLLLVDEDPTSYAAANIEIVRVSAVASDTSMTIVRGAAGTTAAAIGDGAGLTRIGSMHEEGSGAPNTASSNPTKYTNYTQIFKTAYELTGTAEQTYFRTGDPLKNDQIRKSFVHSEKIEQAMLFGIASEATGAGGQPERTMGGISEMVTSNRTVFAADPTITTFINALSPVYDYEAGSAGNERIIYAGNGAINFLNSLVASDSSTRINYDGEIKLYGQILRKFSIPQGSFAIKSHPLMNVHPLYTYSMFIVNPAGLVYRPLKNRDTKIQKNIQANDEDKRKDQWLTECTLELHYERSFGYIGGFKDWP
ncbi:MAG: DUF5309 family protein [Phycisphaerales bacterium]|nr:MAG: DUF5309 family protein [Phycisphaerales bacterium]